jgi:hypothetical protein
MNILRKGLPYRLDVKKRAANKMGFIDGPYSLKVNIEKSTRLNG